MRFFIAFLVAILSMQLYAANILKNADISDGKLLLTFSKQIDTDSVHSIVLKGSDSIRYVVDFKKAILTNKNIAKKLSYSSVQTFRISQFNKHTVRIVIQTDKKYPISHKKVSPRKYAIALPKGKEKPSALFASLSEPKVKTQSKFTKKEKNKKSKSTINSYKIPKKRYVVVIDPGHGGKDSGALGGSRRYMEKSIVLQIGLKVRRYLQRLGFKVHMTRSGDYFVKLGRRTHFANIKHADAFVSIHANAVSGRKKYITHGVETYFLQVSRTARSKRVAARENSVVRQARDRLSKNVLLNLVTTPKLIMSNKLAIDVQRSVLRNLRSRYRGVKDNGVSPAPFWVLVGAQMPSILIETGYITNPKERSRLFNPSYQDKMAKGIAEGISNYFANREKEME